MKASIFNMTMNTQIQKQQNQETEKQNKKKKQARETENAVDLEVSNQLAKNQKKHKKQRTLLRKRRAVSEALGKKTVKATKQSETQSASKTKLNKTKNKELEKLAKSQKSTQNQEKEFKLPAEAQKLMKSFTAKMFLKNPKLEQAKEDYEALFDASSESNETEAAKATNSNDVNQSKETKEAKKADQKGNSKMQKLSDKELKNMAGKLLTSKDTHEIVDTLLDPKILKGIPLNKKELANEKSQIIEQAKEIEGQIKGAMPGIAQQLKKAGVNDVLEDAGLGLGAYLGSGKGTAKGSENSNDFDGSIFGASQGADLKNAIFEAMSDSLALTGLLQRLGIKTNIAMTNEQTTTAAEEVTESTAAVEKQNEQIEKNKKAATSSDFWSTFIKVLSCIIAAVVAILAPGIGSFIALAITVLVSSGLLEKFLDAVSGGNATIKFIAEAIMVVASIVVAAVTFDPAAIVSSIFKAIAMVGMVASSVGFVTDLLGLCATGTLDSSKYPSWVSWAAMGIGIGLSLPEMGMGIGKTIVKAVAKAAAKIAAKAAEEAATAAEDAAAAVCEASSIGEGAEGAVSDAENASSSAESAATSGESSSNNTDATAASQNGSGGETGRVGDAGNPNSSSTATGSSGEPSSTSTNSSVDSPPSANTADAAAGSSSTQSASDSVRNGGADALSDDAVASKANEMQVKGATESGENAVGEVGQVTKSNAPDGINNDGVEVETEDDEEADPFAKKLGKLEKKLEEASKKLEEAIAQKALTEGASEAEIEAATAEVEQAQAAVKQAAKDVEELKLKMKIKAKAIAKLSKTLEDAEESLAKKAKILEDLKSNGGSADEISQAEKAVAKAQKAVEWVESKMTILKMDDEELAQVIEKSLEKASKNLEDKQSIFDDLKNDPTATEDQIADAEADVKEAQNTIQKLKDQMKFSKTVQQRLEEAEDAYAEAQAKADKWKDRLGNMSGGSKAKKQKRILNATGEKIAKVIQIAATAGQAYAEFQLAEIEQELGANMAEIAEYTGDYEFLSQFCELLGILDTSIKKRKEEAADDQAQEVKLISEIINAERRASNALLSA